MHHKRSQCALDHLNRKHAEVLPTACKSSSILGMYTVLNGAQGNCPDNNQYAIVQNRDDLKLYLNYRQIVVRKPREAC